MSRTLDRVARSRRPAVALALCAALAVVFGSAATASAATETLTFGSNLPAPTPGYYDSCSVACTSAQLGLPGTQLVAPVSGRITSFRLRTAAGSDPQQLRFRVLRSVDGTKYTGAGTSGPVAISPTAGITEYPVNMAVKAGDVIGFNQPGGGVAARVIAVNPGAFQAAWFPTLGDGATPKPSDNPQGSDPTRFELLLQAELEYDSSAQFGCTDPTTRVASCADANGVPSVCGPLTAFPQCNLPFNLPTACSGAGTGLPSCNLPGNHIVACGGFGLNLPVCDLPPLEVPQVCGPTTVGLQPCAPANVSVLACGPTDLGFPPCAFKTLIKAPKPIGLDDEGVGHESQHVLKATLGCPDEATAGRRRTGGNGDTCVATVDLIALAQAKIGALTLEAKALSRLFEQTPYPGLASTAQLNAGAFEQRTADEIDIYILRPLDGREPFRPMSSSDRDETIRRLSRGDGRRPYHGESDLYDNYSTRTAIRAWTDSLAAAVAELSKVQKQKKGSGRIRTVARANRPAAAGRRAADPARPLLERSLTLPRGKATRVKLRLKRKVVRKLVKQAPRKAQVVPVRLVVSFDAEPRPIVRFVDFPLEIKHKKPKR